MFAEPTAQEEQLLDTSQVCGRMKRIRNKPVQFLSMQC
jgi:hypothetical protein